MGDVVRAAGEIEGFRRLADSCSTCLIRLGAARSDLQDHVGHIKAALQAILTGVYASLYPGEPGQSAITSTSHDEQNMDVVSSRELRQRIFELRDRVLVIEESLMRRWPAAEWKVLARPGGPVRPWTQLHVRSGLRLDARRRQAHLHQTAFRGLREILEIWSPLRATPARRAVQNLARYLEALEVINQRECLVLHDRAALETVVARLEAANRTARPRQR